MLCIMEIKIEFETYWNAMKRIIIDMKKTTIVVGVIIIEKLVALTVLSRAGGKPHKHQLS